MLFVKECFKSVYTFVNNANMAKICDFFINLLNNFKIKAFLI